LVLEPEVIHDERGFFVRTFDAETLRQGGVNPTSFVQENQSRSGRHVVRGLHLRAAPGEAKLVRCARGAILDVVVDLRPWSKSFGAWESFVLDDQHHRHIHVPRGFGHGFQVLSDVADVCYHHDAAYVAGGDVAVAWNDPDIGVSWPHPPAMISTRDSEAPLLREMLPRLREWFPQPMMKEIGERER
jgi:dTDP-4-dehydrorhamnose 3,5-epimerase